MKYPGSALYRFRKLWQRVGSPAGVAILAGIFAGVLLENVALAATLQSDSLRVSIQSGSIDELRDVASGQNFALPGASLWELQFRSDGKTLSLAAAQAKSLEEGSIEGKFPGRRIIWRHFPTVFPSNLTVEVELTLEPGQRISRWGIAVRSFAPYALAQVRFPIVHEIPRQQHEQLAVPVWMGQLASGPREMFGGSEGKAKRSEWHYPGELSLQCLAFWGQDAGLYMACDDIAAFRKAFAVAGNGSGALGCNVVHWPEMDAAAAGSWIMPYQVQLGTFDGDWFTAAERYRSWATNQNWAVRSRLSQGAVPNWVLKTGLWVWNRGRSEGVLEPAAALHDRAGLPVSVFWHWWHGCAYDSGFPEYLPPREGTTKFKTALAQAQRRGVHALVYMNQRLWGMTTESWKQKGAEAWAVKGSDGEIHPEIYNTFTHTPCASMCLGTAFWRNTYATIAQEAVTGLGVDGIYMDQACLSLSCYDPTHGHPVGGGTYWVNGFRLLASDIRLRCATRSGPRLTSTRAVVPALAGEGCGEPWLPELDLMLSLQVSKERYAAPDGWETIPFFHAVYHPYAVLFGNYSSLTMPPYDELWPPEFAPKEPLKLLDRKFASQFYLEQARAFVWGQQPTLANFRPDQLTSRAEEIDYVIKVAKLRSQSAQFLLHGTMLRPPQIQVAKANIPISRLSIYAGQQGGLTTFEKKVPLALAAAWRAPDGRVAVALASITDEPLPVHLAIPAPDYGVRVGARITRRDAKGTKRLGTVASPQTTLDLKLPRRAVWLIEFGPN